MFGRNNNKTVAETLQHPRYARLAREATALHRERLGTPLGTFLLELKTNGDRFYTKFLNDYGDLTYCTFWIVDPWCLDLTGLYAYVVGDDLKYVDRCRDSMRKRVNQGYGKIHPKNCYLDGQATNCHLNAEIAKVAEEVMLWMCPMDSLAEIVREESNLLRAYQPPWNVQRG